MECTTPSHCRTSSHHYHHILHWLIPHQTPSLTLFQATPHSTSHHQFCHHIAPTPLAHYSTLQYHIGFKSHHIGHIMHHTISSRAAPHFHIPDVPQHHIPCTLRHISDHTIYWPHHLCITTTSRTTFYTILHRISHAPHLASFHHI